MIHAAEELLYRKEAIWYITRGKGCVQMSRVSADTCLEGSPQT